MSERRLPRPNNWRGRVRLVTFCEVNGAGDLVPPIPRLTEEMVNRISEGIRNGKGHGPSEVEVGGWYWWYVHGEDWCGEVRIVTPQGLHVDYSICEEGHMIGTAIPEEVYSPIEEGIKAGRVQGKFTVREGVFAGEWDWDYYRGR